MQYRPEIDGLRALAVVPVVLFHAKFPAFHERFTGQVDRLDFVLALPLASAHIRLHEVLLNQCADAMDLCGLDRRERRAGMALVHLH